MAPDRLTPAEPRFTTARRCAPLLLLLAPAAAAQERPTAATPEPLKLRVGVLTGLQYDLPRFEVAPGRRVELVLRNGDEMAHNMLVVRPGSRERVALAAAMMLTDGEEKDWNPGTDDVLHALPVLEPGNSATLRFTAPAEEGIYPYVCTFPGHASVMYGAMYVGVPMPKSLRDDPNVSPLWRSGAVESGRRGALRTAHARHEAHTRRFHAWDPGRRPLIYRIFMPDASPAAVAVALPSGINACFDATSCRLRYAWVGGFVDPWPVWKGNGNGLATVLGERFVVEERPLLSLDGSAPDFRGYRVVDGYPVFHYRVGEVEVRVRLGSTPGPDGIPGLERRYTIEGLGSPMHLHPSSQDTARYRILDAAGHPLTADRALTPAQARTFTVWTGPVASTSTESPDGAETDGGDDPEAGRPHDAEHGRHEGGAR